MNSRKISRKTLIKIFDKACQKSLKQNQKEIQSIEMNNSIINIMQEKKNLWKQIKIDFPNQKEIKWQNKFKDMKTKYQDLKDQVEYEFDFNDNEAYQEIPRDFLDDNDDQQNNVNLNSIMDNLTDDLLTAFQTSPVVDVILLSQNQNNKFNKQVYRVSGIRKINQFVNTLLGNDELISPSESEYRNRFMKCKSLKYSLQVRDPGTNKMIQRSFSGQGNDLQQCNVFENQNIYIPLSGNCLQNILIKNYPDRKDEIIKTLSQYCEEKQIYRQNIRYCDLSKISELLKIKITNLYNKNLKDKIQYQPKNAQYDILVFIYERHYIQIKSNQYKQAIQDIKDNLVWVQKTLKDAQLQDIKDLKISPNMNDRKLQLLFNQYHGVFVFDLEAYTGDNDDWFQPYACGYFSLETYDLLYSRIQQKKEEDLRKFAYIKPGNNCILDMLKDIDQQNKLEVFKIGEKICNRKQEIILVAHNSAKFDTYLILQLKTIKFEKVVEKNGIICLTINDPQFKNCTFKIIDSYRFIAVSLSKLCTSFEVPQSFCKTQLNHQQITKDNWESLKNEWVPYLQNDVLSLAHIWHSFTKKLHEATKNEDNKSLDLRKFITIPSFAKAVLNQMTTDGDQINSNDDPVVRQFFRKNIRGGRVQCLISHFENETIKHIDLDKQYMKLFQKNKEYILDSKIVDKINKNKNYLIPFDATSLYPSAMALDKYYPNILSARLYDIQNDNITFLYACKKQFVIQCNLNIPQDLKFVPISYKSKDGMAHFRTGYIQNQIINDVDYCELKRFGITIDCISQGLVFEKSILAPYKQFVLQMFQQRNIVKKNDPVLGDMFKLLMNSSYGKLCQKDHVDEFGISSAKEFYDQHYDSQIVDYNVLQNGQIQFKKEFYGDSQKAELHMACYVLSYSKQIMNDFVLQIGAHQETKIYYMDTDSMYIHYTEYQKHLSNVQDGLCGGKNDYGENEAIIKAHFIGSKQKVCYSIALQDYINSNKQLVKMGQISKHITFKGIQTDQFNTLSETVIQCILKQEKLFLEHYIWKKDKTQGIQLCDKEHRQNKLHLKSISNQAQLSKYNYNQETGIYQYKHCDRDKPWCYYFENQDKKLIE